MRSLDLVRDIPTDSVVYAAASDDGNDVTSLSCMTSPVSSGSSAAAPLLAPAASATSLAAPQQQQQALVLDCSTLNNVIFSGSLLLAGQQVQAVLLSNVLLLGNLEDATGLLHLWREPIFVEDILTCDCSSGTQGELINDLDLSKVEND